MSVLVQLLTIKIQIALVQFSIVTLHRYLPVGSILLNAEHNADEKTEDDQVDHRYDQQRKVQQPPRTVVAGTEEAPGVTDLGVETSLEGQAELKAGQQSGEQQGQAQTQHQVEPELAVLRVEDGGVWSGQGPQQVQEQHQDAPETGDHDGRGGARAGAGPVKEVEEQQ